LLGATAIACCAFVGVASAHHSQSARVRIVTIRYRAHDGVARRAYVVLPAWYSRRNDPPLPLIISPHGRGVTPLANAALWGHLPALGSFAVVSPAGEGRKLALYSWGSPGQIADLARMPMIVHLTLPWVHVNRHRVYAIGGSMGGQETLLLLARRPHLLAGAAAFDAVTRFELQYHHFPRVPCAKQCQKTWHGPLGKSLQQLARIEVGGAPKKHRFAYAERSPFTYARRIAKSCVPLQLWWSVKDRIVSDQTLQSGKLFSRIRQFNPRAPVAAFIGTWSHSLEMTPASQLPAALTLFGLLPTTRSVLLAAQQIIPAARGACGRAPLTAPTG
jgi:hypothetical protein